MLMKGYKCDFKNKTNIYIYYIFLVNMLMKHIEGFQRLLFSVSAALFDPFLRSPAPGP